MDHQGVTMSWEEFKKRGVYKFTSTSRLVAFRDQIEKGEPFETPRARSRSSRPRWRIKDWTKTQYGYPIPAIPKWIEPSSRSTTRRPSSSPST
jgi:anaerobic dimethyl sulfoxide reductase subunit A